MHRLSPRHPYPLYGTDTTRQREQAAAAQLPPYTLMQRAGLAVARLAQAIAPHARTVWIACGPGNNGGDGLEAAMHLHQAGRAVCVTWLGHPDHAPADARHAWLRARQAGVPFVETPPAHLGATDLVIDALLGLGVNAQAPARPLNAAWHTTLAHMHATPAIQLAVDMPSGLDADTGQFAPGMEPPAMSTTPSARHTLSLLTLKPGLFTAHGRDACGELWWDDLGTESAPTDPDAWLSAPPPAPLRPHASHKGTQGDVAILGGEGLQARGMGMGGAALLAASAALHAGAGRVLVGLLDDGAMAIDTTQPEIMFRLPQRLDLPRLTVVCGCGGGEAIAPWLAPVLAQSPRLVLDADALNTIATDPGLQALLQQRQHQGHATILTPHPLEAARLLHSSTAEVQADRLAAARQLAEQFGCVAVLKGSGTVVAAPAATPLLNPTGNGRLGTAGTGDVLAGMIGARLAAGAPALQAAAEAVHIHGRLADEWPRDIPLTASALARQGAA